MREIIVYTIAGVAALGVLGYSVHMIVSGLVSADTERWLIIGACAAGGAAMTLMAIDVVKRRRGS